MPTYAYACTQCPHRFDVHQSFSDPSLTECPECSGRLRKLFGSVGVVFKGPGFYRTDSRESGKGRTSSSSTSGTSASGASSGGSSTSGSDGAGTSSTSSSSSSSTSSGTSGTSSSPTPAPAASAASS